MRTGRLWTTMTAFLLVLTGLVTLAAPAQAGAPPKNRPVYYLALGDSLSVGVQPDAGNVNHPTANGYADQLYQALKATTPNLQLKKLGCAVTETSGNMLRGPSDCRDQYRRHVQIADAAEFLLKNRGSVSLVTIDIGANDIEPCGSFEGIDAACVQEAFSNVAANLPKILAALRLAAGPHVPIVAMNYYNPFLAVWLLGDVELARESNETVAAFNGLLGSIYRFFRVPVADVATAFDTTAFEPLVDIGLPVPVPLNVAKICGLTYMCQLGNIHATTDGYGVITQAFLDALP